MDSDCFRILQCRSRAGGGARSLGALLNAGDEAYGKVTNIERMRRCFSDHSLRRATMGSTPAARRAGTTDASSAAKVSDSTANASMMGFHGVTPNS